MRVGSATRWRARLTFAAANEIANASQRQARTRWAKKPSRRQRTKRLLSPGNTACFRLATSCNGNNDRQSGRDKWSTVQQMIANGAATAEQRAYCLEISEALLISARGEVQPGRSGF